MNFQMFKLDLEKAETKQEKPLREREAEAEAVTHLDIEQKREINKDNRIKNVQGKDIRKPRK